MHISSRRSLFSLSLMCLITVLSCNTFSGAETTSPADLALPTETMFNPTQPVFTDPAVGEQNPTTTATPANELRQPSPVEPSRMNGYEIGKPALTELYLSPTGSDDAGNPGTDINHPLRSITAAWSRLPISTTNTGFRLNLLAGTYPCEPLPEDINNCINYFSDRWGTYDYPILIQAMEGPGSVTIRGGINFNNIRYIYLLDLNMIGGGDLPTNISGNNLLHIERGNHILLRRLSVLGPSCDNDTCNNLQEVLKVNQTQYLFVENSSFRGAWHSVVDYFVVQYGHFLNNQIQTAGQWCMYIKGGAAYLTIAGNEFHHCQLGFQSGQSANLAVMHSPWLHYETYAIKFINNILHDIPGVGLSAAGAFNTLFAYNTLYRVGIATDPGYPLVGMTYGERNCTPIDEIPNVIANCPLLVAIGAWGPVMLTESLPSIPDRNVYIFNNLFYNPAPAQTLYSHFDLPGPLNVPYGFENIPSPTTVDQDLRIAGNVIWNGPPNFPLGVEDPGFACQADNPTCNSTQLLSENAINTMEPQLQNPGAGNYHLTPASGAALSAVAVVIPDFTWTAFTPDVPAGDLSNQILQDRDGLPRNTPGVPGAYMLSPQSRIYLPIVRR